MNPVRIQAVAHRHWLVLRRSTHRWFEISFWPVMDVVLWGSLGVYLATQAGRTRAGTPYLLAGVTLFWMFTQSQFAIALGVNEETWTRNILNVFTTPISEVEYLLGIALFGMLKLVLCLLTLVVAETAFFGFNLFSLGWGIVPITALLVVNGWTLGLFAVGLVLRFGQSAEILIWGLNYVLLAFSGVFFPSASLPKGLGRGAEFLPTTKLFAALRVVVDGRSLPWSTLGGAGIATVVFLALGVWFARHMLAMFRRRGFVTRYS
jgi:ABC-2 type transport system permease protein